jgi:hypothetical protein
MSTSTERTTEMDAFVEVMDLIRDRVSVEVKDRVIELWATATLEEFWRGWDKGYSRGAGRS